jgi:hypothetical protein
MHVGARDHHYFVADDSVESRKDVGRDVHSCDVAEVGFAVYIRPSDGDKYFAWQVWEFRIGASDIWTACGFYLADEYFGPRVIIAVVELD